MTKSKILIADDNPTNVELLEAYLADLDCQIQIAVDGQDTLDKVASFQPDLILLDIMMPKLSGFEVCKKIKGDPRTRQIMVLMVTALNEQGDIERAVKAGCDDFFEQARQQAGAGHPGENHAQAPLRDRRVGSPAALHRRHRRRIRAQARHVGHLSPVGRSMGILARVFGVARARMPMLPAQPTADARQATTGTPAGRS